MSALTSYELNNAPVQQRKVCLTFTLSRETICYEWPGRTIRNQPNDGDVPRARNGFSGGFVPFHHSIAHVHRWGK